MGRSLLGAGAAAVALALGSPAGADARTQCAAEATAPTAANGAAVSDAIFCLVNQVRASHGLPALRRDSRLDAAARLHSEDMAIRGFFAHTTPEGLTPADRAAAQGYTAGVGENIAAGHADARAVMTGWMASAGHCRNVLGPARDLGVGTAASPRPHFTQAFGNYAATESPAAAGCPYALDLDTLVLPSLVETVAGPLAGTAPDGLDTADAAPARPVLSGLTLSPARLRRHGRGGAVLYRLSAPATVTFRVQRAAAGSRTRWRTLAGSLVDDGRRGANSLPFRGRLRGRWLSPGRYRLRAVARSEAGSASAPRTVTLRIVRR
jgi:uncharacterized protein YkwD